MYTKQMKYFLTVAEVLSFRRAAELLSISQPALSSSIKALEDEYEARLFERGPGGVRLTQAGRELYGSLRSAYDSIERGRRELELTRMGSRGHLAVGAPTGLIDQLLPEIISRVCVESPGSTFSIRYGYLDDLLRDLRGWRLDVLLTTYWPDADLAADLELLPFADLGMSIYCRSSHALLRKSGVSLADLSKAQWILAETAGMRGFVQQIFGVGSLGVLDRRITHNYPLFLIEMLQRMDLLSLIPDYVAAEHVRSGKLQRVRYDAFQPRLHAGVAYLRARHMSRLLQIFARVAHDAGRAYFEKLVVMRRPPRRAARSRAT